MRWIEIMKETTAQKEKEPRFFAVLLRNNLDKTELALYCAMGFSLENAQMYAIREMYERGMIKHKDYTVVAHHAILCSEIIRATKKMMEPPRLNIRVLDKKEEDTEENIRNKRIRDIIESGDVTLLKNSDLKKYERDYIRDEIARRKQDGV